MGKKRKLVSENGRGTFPWSELNEKSNISKPKEGKISYFSIQRIQNIIDERKKKEISWSIIFLITPLFKIIFKVSIAVI